MFFLGFLTSHLYRRWYTEVPRMAIVPERLVWHWGDSWRDFEKYGTDTPLYLDLAFTLTNPGAAVSIVDAHIQIKGLFDDDVIPGIEQPLVDSAHQGRVHWETEFRANTPPPKTPDREFRGVLLLRDSLGKTHGCDFRLPMWPERRAESARRD